MARAYPRGPTAEEEQRNLEAFERYAQSLERRPVIREWVETEESVELSWWGRIVRWWNT